MSAHSKPAAILHKLLHRKDKDKIKSSEPEHSPTSPDKELPNHDNKDMDPKDNATSSQNEAEVEQTKQEAPVTGTEGVMKRRMQRHVQQEYEQFEAMMIEERRQRDIAAGRRSKYDPLP